MLLDFGRRLFLDGCDDDLHALGARRVQNQQRKLAVARDEPDSLRRISHVSASRDVGSRACEPLS